MAFNRKESAKDAALADPLHEDLQNAINELKLLELTNPELFDGSSLIRRMCV